MREIFLTHSFFVANIAEYNDESFKQCCTNLNGYCPTRKQVKRTLKKYCKNHQGLIDKASQHYDRFYSSLVGFGTKALVNIDQININWGGGGGSKAFSVLLGIGIRWSTREHCCLPFKIPLIIISNSYEQSGGRLYQGFANEQLKLYLAL